MKKEKKVGKKLLIHGWKLILCNILSAVVGGLIVNYHQLIIHGLTQFICSVAGFVVITIVIFYYSGVWYLYIRKIFGTAYQSSKRAMRHKIMWT